MFILSIKSSHFDTQVRAIIFFEKAIPCNNTNCIRKLMPWIENADWQLDTGYQWQTDDMEMCLEDGE